MDCAIFSNFVSNCVLQRTQGLDNSGEDSLFSLQISAVLMFILENTFSTLIDPFRMFLNYDLFDNSSACCAQTILGFRGGSVVKNLPEMQKLQETWFRFMGWEDPLEEGMATHSSILAWRIPQTKEPGRLQFIWLQRVAHD